MVQTNANTPTRTLTINFRGDSIPIEILWRHKLTSLRYFSILPFSPLTSASRSALSFLLTDHCPSRDWIGSAIEVPLAPALICPHVVNNLSSGVTFVVWTLRLKLSQDGFVSSAG